jgi:hypothetical protein
VKRIALLVVFLVLCSGCRRKSIDGFHLAPPRPDALDESILPPAGAPITIFVHGGARPLSSMIPLPGLHSKCPRGLVLSKNLGEECVLGKNVARILSTADSKMFPRDSFFNFGWSGFLSFTHREKAGQELYNVLAQLRADKRYEHSKITVITFSHGGNVALNAGITAAAKKDKRQLVDLLIMTACPVVVPTQDWVASPLFKTVISLYSKSDSFQVLDPQGLYRDLGDIPCPSLFSKRRFDVGTRLIQAEVKINNRSQTGHLGFTTERVLKAVPKIVTLLLDPEKRKQLPQGKNYSYCVTINTKDHEVTGCKSLSQWKTDRRLEPYKVHARAGCTVCERYLQSQKHQSPRKPKAHQECPNVEAL